jgi:hypothetical protein
MPWQQERMPVPFQHWRLRWVFWGKGCSKWLCVEQAAGGVHSDHTEVEGVYRVSQGDGKVVTMGA